MQRISPRGLTLIKSFEGLRLQPYICSGGHLTVGYGHKILPTENFDFGITEPQAAQLLAMDLMRFEDGVTKLCSEIVLTQNQFDALVSFAYNLGLGALAGSTLLKLLREDDAEGAANEFARWSYAKGKWLEGLNRRRLAEANLFVLAS